MKIYLELNVPDDWGNRVDMQSIVEAEIKADRWAWHKAVPATQPPKEPPMNHVNSPRTDDAAIESEILAKGLTAPRVTPADIEANIACEVSFVVGNVLKDCPIHESLNLLTLCILTLNNGFTVTGESACASPENFDAEIGRKIARANAVQKIWPLMGYALRETLFRAK